jgi:hypothetical protein
LREPTESLAGSRFKSPLVVALSVTASHLSSSAASVVSLSRAIFRPGAPSTRLRGGCSLSTAAMIALAARAGSPG